MRRLIAGLCLFALHGCAEPVEVLGSVETIEATSLAVSDESEDYSKAYQVSAENCQLELTPEPGLEKATETAATRWAAATGCDVFLGDNGVPVFWVTQDELGAVGEAQVGGMTSIRLGSSPEGHWLVKRIRIAIAVPGDLLTSVLVHELGHALGFPGHTDKGVMAPTPLGQWPDKPAIQAVCSKVECS